MLVPGTQDQRVISASSTRASTVHRKLHMTSPECHAPLHGVADHVHLHASRRAGVHRLLQVALYMAGAEGRTSKGFSAGAQGRNVRKQASGCVRACARRMLSARHAKHSPPPRAPPASQPATWMRAPKCLSMVVPPDRLMLRYSARRQSMGHDCTQRSITSGSGVRQSGGMW